MGHQCAQAAMSPLYNNFLGMNNASTTFDKCVVQMLSAPTFNVIAWLISCLKRICPLQPNYRYSYFHNAEPAKRSTSHCVYKPKHTVWASQHVAHCVGKSSHCVYKPKHTVWASQHSATVVIPCVITTVTTNTPTGLLREHPMLQASTRCVQASTRCVQASTLCVQARTRCVQASI